MTVVVVKAHRRSDRLCSPVDHQVVDEPAIRFILEVDKLKNVSRKVRPVGLDRYENSAEHSWQLGLFATSLASYAEPNTDLNHVIRMLLVHDIGEIDTGDTFVFVQGGWDERKAAELIAVKRIFLLLPQNQAAAPRTVGGVRTLADSRGSVRYLGLPDLLYQLHC